MADVPKTPTSLEMNGRHVLLRIAWVTVDSATLIPRITAANEWAMPRAMTMRRIDAN
jgi:hypothetical protein